MSSENSRLSRRRLLGTGSVLGAAGLLSTSLVQSAEKTPEKFVGLRPLRPAAKFSAAEAVDLPLPPFAVLVLNKAGYGPRPGDVSAFESLPGGNNATKLGSWLDEQLFPDDLLDTDLNDRISLFTDPGLAYDMIDKTPG